MSHSTWSSAAQRVPVLNKHYNAGSQLYSSPAGVHPWSRAQPVASHIKACIIFTTCLEWAVARCLFASCIELTPSIIVTCLALVLSRLQNLMLSHCIPVNKHVLGYDGRRVLLHRLPSADESQEQLSSSIDRADRCPLLLISKRVLFSPHKKSFQKESTCREIKICALVKLKFQ